jgi:hypothetical protein
MKFLRQTDMRKILFLLIFITTTLYSQNTSYFWNDVGISLQQLFIKMSVPSDIEYQPESNNYWFAYDFGEKAVIYIIDKGFVSNVIYMESGLDTDIARGFINMLNLSLEDGFKSDTSGVGYYIHTKENIIQTANISRIMNEFVLTILVTTKSN